MHPSQSSRLFAHVNSVFNFIHAFTLTSRGKSLEVALISGGTVCELLPSLLGVWLRWKQEAAEWTTCSAGRAQCRNGIFAEMCACVGSICS